jgi:hypothetical protein
LEKTVFLKKPAGQALISPSA